MVPRSDGCSAKYQEGPLGFGYVQRMVAFSYDGSRVVSGSHDKTVWIWNATTGEIELLGDGRILTCDDVGGQEQPSQHAVYLTRHRIPDPNSIVEGAKHYTTPNGGKYSVKHIFRVDWRENEQ